MHRFKIYKDSGEILKYIKFTKKERSTLKIPKQFTQYGFCKKMLKEFNPEERSKFDFIYILAMIHSNIRIDEMIDQYNLRRHLALGKYKTLKDFDKDELFNAGKDLTQINLGCDWEELNLIVIKTLEWYMETKESGPWLIGRTDDLKIHFLGVIWYAGLVEEYLKMDIDFKNIWTNDYDINNLKDFDKVIELFIAFKWIIYLNGMIETGKYEKRSDDSTSELALIAFYKNESIPRGNNSKLYQKFTHYSFEPNRIGHEDTVVKNKNKIKLFTRVIEKLSGEAKNKAAAEFKKLQDNISKNIYFESDLKDLKNSH